MLSAGLRVPRFDQPCAYLDLDDAAAGIQARAALEQFTFD